MEGAWETPRVRAEWLMVRGFRAESDPGCALEAWAQAGMLPSTDGTERGPEASVAPEASLHPPERGPAQLGAHLALEEEPGAESSWLPLSPPYCHGLGAVRAPLKCPGPPALHGGSLAAFGKVRARGKATCPADEHPGLCLAAGKGEHK